MYGPSNTGRRGAPTRGLERSDTGGPRDSTSFGREPLRPPNWERQLRLRSGGS